MSLCGVIDTRLRQTSATKPTRLFGYVAISYRASCRGVEPVDRQAHKPHGYPCRRGTAIQLGPYETLLWTQGNLPEMTTDGRDYFKEGKGTPEPLLLVRHAGLGSVDDLCRATLVLTKLDWNNDGPYDRLPVTLNFAQILAKVVKRMPTLEARPYAFRQVM
jgi:hypothetical protein